MENTIRCRSKRSIISCFAFFMAFRFYLRIIKLHFFIEMHAWNLQIQSSPNKSKQTIWDRHVAICQKWVSRSNLKNLDPRTIGITDPHKQFWRRSTWILNPTLLLAERETHWGRRYTTCRSSDNPLGSKIHSVTICVTFYIKGFYLQPLVQPKSVQVENQEK